MFPTHTRRHHETINGHATRGCGCGAVRANISSTLHTRVIVFAVCPVEVKWPRAPHNTLGLNKILVTCATLVAPRLPPPTVANHKNPLNRLPQAPNMSHRESERKSARALATFRVLFIVRHARPRSFALRAMSMSPPTCTHA